MADSNEWQPMRQVFFSFSWASDVWRANKVRHSGVIPKGGCATADFVDKAEIEKVKKPTDAAIRKWIDAQLAGTSVTCVLIGSNTHRSKWVKYEIKQSIKKGNGLLGVRIHNIKGNKGERSVAGKNPLLPYKTKPTIADRLTSGLLGGGLGFWAARVLVPHYAVPVGIATTILSSVYPNEVDYAVYDWIDDDGRGNLGDWIEAAAKQAGR